MKRILIIDDDIHIGNMLEEALSKEGYEVLRAYSGTEALLVLAGAKPDLILLLLGGAVDYVTKPFHMRELLARIFVHLKNAESMTAFSELTFGDIVLAIDTHTVKAGDTEIKLTRTEYAILKLLMQNPTQVVTKSLLLERISADTPDCTESSLKMHISNLRKKLREVTDKDYIEAVWGIGFKMRAE